MNYLIYWLQDTMVVMMKLIIFEVIGLTLAIIINSHGIFIIEVKNYNSILKGSSRPFLFIILKNS